jgi:hypothetical protein
MTKKPNEQHDKQRSQKDSLHNDKKKQNEQHDKKRSQKDSLHNDKKNKIKNMTNNEHKRKGSSVIVVCHVVHFVFLVIV